MARVQDVASYLVDLRNLDRKKDKNYTLCNLKMQKLLFFCQHEHMRQTRRPLMPDARFESWRYGPTDPRVYRRFSKYGQNDIGEKEALRWSLHPRERAFIESVWNDMKHLDRYTLVEMAKREHHVIANEERRRKRMERDHILFPHLRWKR